MRDIAQFTKVDKSTISGIGKCFRSNDIRAKNTPFVIVQRKKVMTRWFDPLRAEPYGAHVLTENNWFLSNGVVKMSEKGSMTSEIIPSFSRHLDKYARQFLPATTSYLLRLDVHQDWMGVA